MNGVSTRFQMVEGGEVTIDNRVRGGYWREGRVVEIWTLETEAETVPHRIARDLTWSVFGGGVVILMRGGMMWFAWCVREDDNGQVFQSLSKWWSFKVECRVYSTCIMSAHVDAIALFGTQPSSPEPSHEPTPRRRAHHYPTPLSPRESILLASWSSAP